VVKWSETMKKAKRTTRIFLGLLFASSVLGAGGCSGGGGSAAVSGPGPQFFYVANFGSHNVSAFTINASAGALIAVAGSPFGAGAGPASVITTRRIP